MRGQAHRRNGRESGEAGTAARKALLNFSRKIVGLRGKAPIAHRSGRNPLFTKKCRNSLKNSRKGFFKWPSGPSDKERMFSGQQSSELLATGERDRLPLLEPPSSFPDVPGHGMAGVGLASKCLAACGPRFLFFSSPRRARKGLGFRFLRKATRAPPFEPAIFREKSSKAFDLRGVVPRNQGRFSGAFLRRKASAFPWPLRKKVPGFPPGTFCYSNVSAPLSSMDCAASSTPILPVFQVRPPWSQTA